MIITQREKEEKLFKDYQQLKEKGLGSTKAVNALMKKYSYGYEASVWAVIRRCKKRLNEK